MSRTQHLKLFLNPGHRSPPDLGTAIRLHTEGKKLCLAANLLFHLLSNSHKPDGLAQEILHECQYTDSVRPIGEKWLIKFLAISAYCLVVVEIHADRGNNFLEPGRWADRMLDALPQVPVDSKDGAMPDVNRLAAHYLTHLCFACIPCHSLFHSDLTPLQFGILLVLQHLKYRPILVPIFLEKSRSKNSSVNQQTIIKCQPWKHW